MLRSFPDTHREAASTSAPWTRRPTAATQGPGDTATSRVTSGGRFACLNKQDSGGPHHAHLPREDRMKSSTPRAENGPGPSPSLSECPSVACLFLSSCCAVHTWLVGWSTVSAGAPCPFLSLLCSGSHRGSLWPGRSLSVLSVEVPHPPSCSPLCPHSTALYGNRPTVCWPCSSTSWPWPQLLPRPHPPR